MEKPSEESLINNDPTAPVPTASETITKKKAITTTVGGKKRTSNFSNDFLVDFKLFIGNPLLKNRVDGKWVSKTDWVYSKTALERFHLPIIYPNPHGSEDDNHFRTKMLIHDYIYDNYYMDNECKFMVTTELEQRNNCFYSYIDGKIPVFFTLDICIIRESDYQVFDIEVDGPEHRTRRGMMKAEIRDSWLFDRYGVLTYRVDKNDVDCINYKKIDKFISQPAVENPRSKKKKVT